MITDISLTATSSQFEIPLPSGGFLPARSWGMSQDCKAVALLVHGLCANSSWFEAFGRQLKVRRIYAVSYDLSGFGKRTGETFGGYTQWIDDLVRAYDYLREQFPKKPIYVIGNSMGALLSLVAAQYIKPHGLILLSPGFDGHPATFTWAYRGITVAKAYLNPEADVNLPYDESFVTRDVNARAWVNKESQGQFKLPGKYMLELLKLSNAVKDTAQSVSMPVLMMTAGHDRIVNNKVNAAFIDKLSAPSKKHKQFQEAWHDLMFDPLVDEVAEEVAVFMTEHTAERLTTG